MYNMNGDELCPACSRTYTDPDGIDWPVTECPECGGEFALEECTCECTCDDDVVDLHADHPLLHS